MSERIAEPVLVAEDSTLLGALLQDALRAHRVADEVRVLRDGQSFLAAYERMLEAREPVRLLILDIMMPGLSGLDTGRQIRRLEAAAGAPLAPMVFFSSRSEDEEIAAAVADCFPARFVQKAADGPAMVAVVGARLVRSLLQSARR